jgi:hypothetical protein
VAGPPGQSAPVREVVALLLLAAVAAQMFAALVGLVGRSSFRLAVLGAWGEFLGFGTLLLIGLAVAIGVGGSPGPRARLIGTAVVVLLGVALVFGVLLGLPAIGIASNGLIDGFGRFVVFLSTLAMYAGLVLYVRSVLAEVPGVPLFSRTPASQPPAGAQVYGGQPPAYGQATAQPPQYGQPQPFGQAQPFGQPQQYGQPPVSAMPPGYGQPQPYGPGYPQQPPSAASPPAAPGAHPFARPGEGTDAGGGGTPEIPEPGTETQPGTEHQSGGNDTDPNGSGRSGAGE